MRAAAAQIEVKWLDTEANLAKVLEFTQKIAEVHQADLIVFPELTNSGYVIGRQRKDFAEFSKKFLKTAEKIPGRYTDLLGKLAAKYGIYIVIGLLELHPVIPATLYNSAVLIGPSGQIVGVTHKAHIIGEERYYFYPGNTVDVFCTEIGNIGILICADSNFPELPRVLALKGAEIVCVTYNRIKGTADGDEEAFYRFVSCRAFENNNFYVTCNRVGVEGEVLFEGRSCICGPNGHFLARSEGEKEEVVVGELHREVFERVRMRYGRFRDRRPDLYGPICQR